MIILLIMMQVSQFQQTKNKKDNIYKYMITTLRFGFMDFLYSDSFDVFSYTVLLFVFSFCCFITNYYLHISFSSFFVGEINTERECARIILYNIQQSLMTIILI